MTATKIRPHLSDSVKARWSFVARLRFPNKFLVNFEIPYTSNNTVHGNVVSLREQGG